MPQPSLLAQFPGKPIKCLSHRGKATGKAGYEDLNAIRLFNGMSNE